MIGVAFSSPAPGSSVGRTFTVTGTWSDDGTVDNQGHDQFSLLQILVDFGANRFPKVAATIGDGTWSATGSVPAGTRRGDVLNITFTADVLAISSSGDQPGGYQVVDTRQVVAEQTPPQVVIDPFPNDRTVNQLPFRLPLLSGRALDASGVTSVQYAIDDGPRNAMDSVAGDPAQVNWSKANLDFGAGEHTLVVFATDSFGNEGTASTPVIVRLSQAPPPPPPDIPVDLTFTPTFRHTNWINNVDRIEAGGPNGFNVRYDAIDSDLRQASTVVDQIDAALKAGGVHAGEQRVTLGVDLVSLQNPGQNGWFYDEAGAAHPAGGTGGGTAMMGLSLPDGSRLKSFRAAGLYGGVPLILSITLARVSLADENQSDKLAEVASGPGFTNPYDATVPVDAALATVDNTSFRYLVRADARFVGAEGSGPTTLSTVQLVYTAI